ncbi:hypothetical protein [Streptomyces angustmyceticus]|uniref:hypothetical protein n=1 Tax=Streptomyces angustmyceticus TaxID=285578 RepID=UPI003811DFCB
MRLSESSEPSEHYIFSDSRTMVLECGIEWDSLPERNPVERERRAAHLAVRALAALCEGLIRPTTFGVTRSWVDEYHLPVDGVPPRWNWWMRTPQAPPDARSRYVDPQVVEATTLDERSMLTLVDRVLDDPCEPPEGTHLAWDEMVVDHTWARLPEPDRHIGIENGHEELCIDDHDNKARRGLIPLDRAHGDSWVTVPETMVWCPFLLRVDRSCGTAYPDGLDYDEFIELTIDVNWSFWWHPGEGRALLDRAVNRVLRQGWRHAHPSTSLR